MPALQELRRLVAAEARRLQGWGVLNILAGMAVLLTHMGVAVAEQPGTLETVDLLHEVAAHLAAAALALVVLLVTVVVLAALEAAVLGYLGKAQTQPVQVAVAPVELTVQALPIEMVVQAAIMVAEVAEAQAVLQ